MGFDWGQDGDCHQYWVWFLQLIIIFGSEVRPTSHTIFGDIDSKIQICSFACSLLRQGMKQIIINLESPQIQALEKAGDKAAISKVNLYFSIASLLVTFKLVCFSRMELSFLSISDLE